MIISDEQARLAAYYMRTHGDEHLESVVEDVSSDLIARANAVALSAPDIRPQRVDDAKERLSSGELDACDVASKMLGRIVSDSLR